MKNSFGSSVILTLFGESHGLGLGAVLDGLAPGITVDEDFIRRQLSLRRPVGDISTPRAEPDNFVIESGVFGGKTTGTPICIVIPNVNTRSKDYSELRSKARPGHADYAAYTKYHGFEDYRGGGHFSGRITAGIAAAGAIAISALKNKGIYIGTHIKSIAGVTDREFRNIADDIKAVSQKEFAVLEDGVKEKMINEITAAKADGVSGFILSSGYRTRERQSELYAESSSGYVNAPGESEHELGLSFDVTARTDESSFDKTEQFRWLSAHAHEYGFVLRYPVGKESLTGVPYESWHYRYVGIDAAQTIHDNGWCLEEYAAQ